MTKLVVFGVALAVLLLDAAPAFAKRGYYRGYGYAGVWLLRGWLPGVRLLRPTAVPILPAGRAAPLI